jgi:hypothetical protein
MCFSKKKAIGAGSNKGYPHPPGVPDQRYQILGKKQRFSSGEADRLESLPCGGIQDPFDFIGGQATTDDRRPAAHSALRTMGIAVIGQLDHQLTGHSVAGKSDEIFYAHRILIIVLYKALPSIATVDDRMGC